MGPEIWSVRLSCESLRGTIKPRRSRNLFLSGKTADGFRCGYIGLPPRLPWNDCPSNVGLSGFTAQCRGVLTFGVGARYPNSWDLCGLNVITGLWWGTVRFI